MQPNEKKLLSSQHTKTTFAENFVRSCWRSGGMFSALSHSLPIVGCCSLQKKGISRVKSCTEIPHGLKKKKKKNYLSHADR